jgi:uroporphyrinogen decarboxylase
MTSRERVLACLSHQEPDRIPIALGQATGDGITLVAYRNLLRHLGMSEGSARLKEETEYAVVLDLNCAFFLRCCELRGWENFYMDLVADVPFAEALMDRYLTIRLAMAERALQEVGDDVDIVMVTSDDLGMTERTLISPALYRALIKPRQKRTFDFFRARTGAKRYYHTDGAVYPLLPDLVEIGVEVLNPVEVRAAGMGDTQKLKREFGDRLSFWGAVDTHHVLPCGTPEEVREEVRRRIQDLGPGGGYVVSPVHNIQPDVPPENVVAMYEAAYELGRYPLA